MRAPRSLLIGSITLAAHAALAAIACSPAATAEMSAPSVSLHPTIIVPDDLIGEILFYKLEVYAGAAVDGGIGIGCDTATGRQTGITLAPPLLTSTSAQGDAACGDAGFTRCFKNVTLDQSPTIPRVFVISGFGPDRTTVVAVGCGETLLTQASQSVTVNLVRVVPPATCGNGSVEPGETCDPGAGTDPECPVGTCQTVEALLSSGTGPANMMTATGSPGDKTSPAFTWPLGGDFLAFFTDNSSGLGTLQVSMRILDGTLSPTAGQGQVAQVDSLYLPNNPSVFPATPEAFDQMQPQAIQANGIDYVVFADDTNGDYDIRLRSMDGATLTAQQNNACGINGTNGAGETGSKQTAPAVALSNGALFVAWQDDAGQVSGRTFTPSASGACGTLGKQNVLSVGSSNSHVSVAGVPDGWVAVWQNGTDIVLETIASDGTPSVPHNVEDSTLGTGAQVSPTVAALSSGAFAVAWAGPVAGTSAIFAQRYNSDGSVVASDDQSRPINNLTSVLGTSTSEVTPFIAASPAVGGSYVVTWVDQNTPNHVRARLLAGTDGTLKDGSGYLVNTTDGQTNEFQVSLVAGRPRANPTAAVGGSGPFIAFGWQDSGATAPYGIIARRFPIPTQ